MKAAAKSHKEEGPFKVKSPPDDPQRKSFSRTKPISVEKVVVVVVVVLLLKPTH